jgi:hypothetical protein
MVWRRGVSEQDYEGLKSNSYEIFSASPAAKISGDRESPLSL